MKMDRKLLGIGVLALAISLIAVGSITAIGSAEKETAQSPLLEYRLNEAAGDMGFYTRNIDWEYEATESGIECEALSGEEPAMDARKDTSGNKETCNWCTYGATRCYHTCDGLETCQDTCQKTCQGDTCWETCQYTCGSAYTCKDTCRGCQ